MAGTFYYCRPDEWATAGASVTTSAGTTDSDYTDDWICDTRAGRPARATNGTVTWAATFTSAEVGIIAVCNCKSNVNATISGGVSTTVTAGALQPDGIRLNGYALVTPAAQTTLSVGFSGASAAVVLGEFVAGKARTLTLPKMAEDDRGEMDHTRQQDVDLSSMPPFDPGLSSRAPWTGTFVLTTSERDNVIAWYRAQKNGTLPSLIVPTTAVNDAWVCFMKAPQYKAIGPALWRVKLTFVEVPRVRWA